MSNKKEENLKLSRLKELLEYDPAIGVFIWKNKSAPRSKIKVGSIAGKIRKDGYLRISVDGYRYLEHRLARFYVHGEFPFGAQNFIDHIDGNKSNNQLSNLRVCTNAENMRNRGKNSNNTTGYKGVRKDERDGRYYPRIQNPTAGRYESLGGYATPEEASIVYEAKSIEYYGEFHFL